MEFYYQNASTTGATFALPLLGAQSKRRINLVMSYMDLAGTLAFLVVVVSFSAFQAHVLREVRDKTVTISDYSLQVWALPKVRSRDPRIRCCLPPGRGPALSSLHADRQPAAYWVSAPLGAAWCSDSTACSPSKLCMRILCRMLTWRS